MYETLHGVPETPAFVTHLECSYTGKRYEADRLHNLSRAGKPLLVRYDLEGIRKALSKDGHVLSGSLIYVVESRVDQASQ